MAKKNEKNWLQWFKNWLTYSHALHHGVIHEGGQSFAEGVAHRPGLRRHAGPLHATHDVDLGGEDNIFK